MKTLSEKISKLKLIAAEAWPSFDWSKDLEEILAELMNGTGELSNLSTSTKTSLVAAINEIVADVKTLEDLHIPCEINLSALENSTLTAEQAVAAGFTSEVLAFLMAAHNPIVEFSNMCVSFNAVKTVSEGVVNQTAIIVDESSGTVTVYKAVLTLNSTGAVTYTVAALS